MRLQPLLGAAVVFVSSSLALVAAASAAEKPIGAFSQENPGMVDFKRLVLFSDGRYAVEYIDLGNRPAKERGTYTLRAHGRGYLVKFNSRQLLNRLYTIYNRARGTLDVKWSNSGRWVRMTSAGRGGWCARSPDCRLQGLAQPRCIGEWSCRRASCSFRCGAGGR